MSRHTTPLATHNSPLYFGNIGDIEAPAVSQVIGGQISGSGITGNRPGQGSGGGGAGGPRGPGNNQTRADERPAIGGGLDRHGRPWTGGSLDPSDKDYHLGRNAKPASVCCLRTEKKATCGSGKGKKGGKKSPDKNKWQSVKATMKRDGTKYYWCKWCGYGAGRWVTSHKSEDCRFKKKKDDTSDDDEEVVAAEIAECLTIL